MHRTSAISLTSIRPLQLLSMPLVGARGSGVLGGVVVVAVADVVVGVVRPSPRCLRMLQRPLGNSR